MARFVSVFLMLSVVGAMAAWLRMKTQPLVAQAERARAVEVAEDALGVRHELLGQFAHRATEHADGVGDVGSCVHRAVDESADQTLVASKELRVDIFWRLRERIHDVRVELLAVGQVAPCRRYGAGSSAKHSRSMRCRHGVH